MNDRDHWTGASAPAISWQCRLTQAANRRLLKPRLTLARGVEPLRRTLKFVSKILPRPPSKTRSPGQLGGVAGEWVRCSRPNDETGPIILHFHAGAFVAGSPSLSRAIVWKLAARCGGDGFSPRYRLAPEHPFPAALDDALACYRGLVSAGVTPQRIVISGESAGGAIALALALRTKVGPRPRALVLISPWLDLTLSGASLTDPAVDDPGLPLGLMREARPLYVPDGTYHDPNASPLFGALDGLPPVLIQVGTREILRDDSRRLASRLQQAGAEHRFEEWAGMHHIWHHAPIRVPEAEQALDAIARFIAGAV